MNVLLIEDDPDAATHLSALIMAAWGATVHHAGTGEDALRTLGRVVDDGGVARFDLITLDLGLPDVDGIELCREVRRLTVRQRVPILVISAHTDEDHLEAAFAAGAIDYLAKPVRPRELYARIGAALREQRDHQRLSATTERLLGVTAELQRSNRTLERLATVDPLTQIANRRQFNVSFHRAWRRTCRGNGSIAVVMIDLDHFHEFNQAHGHLAGDDCLVRVAAALVAAAQRPADEVARWGGEEFVCVLPDVDLAGAVQVGERARAAVEALAIAHGSSLSGPHVTISAGVAAMRPRPELAPETLLAAADEALFEAKRLGRNRVCDAATTGPEYLVEVDPLIAARIPRFLDNRRDDARVLLEAARTGALDVAHRIGHNLKGIGASYGFDPISEIGRRIEAASSARDRAEVRRAALDLASYLDHVRVAPSGGTGIPNGRAGRLATGSQPR